MAEVEDARAGLRRRESSVFGLRSSVFGLRSSVFGLRSSVFGLRAERVLPRPPRLRVSRRCSASVGPRSNIPKSHRSSRLPPRLILSSISGQPVPPRRTSVRFRLGGLLSASGCDELARRGDAETRRTGGAVEPGEGERIQRAERDLPASPRLRVNRRCSVWRFPIEHPPTPITLAAASKANPLLSFRQPLPPWRTSIHFRL